MSSRTFLISSEKVVSDGDEVRILDVCLDQASNQSFERGFGCITIGFIGGIVGHEARALGIANYSTLVVLRCWGQSSARCIGPIAQEKRGLERCGSNAQRQLIEVMGYGLLLERANSGLIVVVAYRESSSSFLEQRDLGVGTPWNESHSVKSGSLSRSSLGM